MMTPKYAPFLVDFVKSMRIVKNGNDYELVIPETKPGKYTFTVPEVNLDKIPRRVAKKIRAGVDPQSIRDEWKDYIMIGDWAPWPAEHFEIDTQAIKQAVKVTALQHRQVVLDGYDVNSKGTFTDARQHKPELFARIEETKASAVLAGGLSEEFRGQLGQCLDIAIKPPLTTDKVSKERIQELMAWIQLGFEDFKDLRSWEEVVMQRIHIPDIPRQSYEAMQELSTEFMAVFSHLWGPKVALAIFENRHMFLSNNSDRGIDLMADRKAVEVLLPQVKLSSQELEPYRKCRTSTLEAEMRAVAEEQTKRPEMIIPKVRRPGQLVRKAPSRDQRRNLN
jgi:hypothetical protein